MLPMPCTAFQPRPAVSHQALQAASGRGISFQGLLGFLQKYAADKESVAIAIKLIDIHGLNFRPTAENIAALKEAAGSPDLLLAIERARKPPPAVPMKREGMLEIACQPVDCAVSFDGRPVGHTRQGLLPAMTVTAGNVAVAVSRPDYEPEPAQEIALVRENQTTRLRFRLQPARAALVRRGATLFRRMLDSLGSAAVPFANGGRLAGTFFVPQAGEGRIGWSVVASLSADRKGQFDVTRGAERYRILQTRSGYAWKKAPQSAEAGALEDAIRLVLREQLSNLVRRLQDPGLTILAADLAPGADGDVFRAEGGSESYRIALDAAGRPAEIQVQSAGFSSGTRVVYSNYEQQDGGAYPGNLRVVLPGGTAGVEVHFDSLKPGSGKGGKGRHR